MDQQRIDLWLHRVCLFKSRSQASKNIRLGRVKVNGQKVKPHRIIRIGDEIDIERVNHVQRVKVLGFTPRSIPKAQARTLYEDITPALSKRAEKFLHHQTFAKEPWKDRGKPDKRTRRILRKMKGNM